MLPDIAFFCPDHTAIRPEFVFVIAIRPDLPKICILFSPYRVYLHIQISVRLLFHVLLGTIGTVIDLLGTTLGQIGTIGTDNGFVNSICS